MSAVMANKQQLVSYAQHTVKKLASAQTRISYGLTLLLVALIAWTLAVLLWSMLTPQAPLTPWTPQPVTGVSVNKASSNHMPTLTNGQLFGHYNPEAAPVVSKPVVHDAPQTRLNLSLVGAVASSNDKLSLAVIANKGQQATYGIGETIEGTQVSLKVVFADRVIIDNGGRDETLMLQGIDYDKNPAPVVSRTEPTRTAMNNPAPQIEDMEAIRDEITSDPQKIFQYIRLSQVMENGQLKGYRVRPGKQRELFDSVGLQDGDIATSLNGQDLTDPSQMQSLWKTAMDSTEWVLMVDRDGQQHEIYIEF